MKRLWILRILGIGFILSAGWITYYNFTHSGRSPFWQNTRAAVQNIYQLPGTWYNEQGDSVKLSDFKGSISMMSFVYLDCKLSCPRIMADLKNLDDSYTNRPPNFFFRIFLFQPESKSSITRKEFRKRYGITGRKHWQILTPKSGALDILADVFSLSFGSVANGTRQYKHSNFFTLISVKGKVIFQQRSFLGNLQSIIKIIDQENNGIQQTKK